MSLALIKYGIIAAIILGWSLFCYERGKDAEQSRESENIAKAVLAQQKSYNASEEQLQAIVRRYEATAIDPVVPTLAHKLLISASSCPVHEATNTAGAAVPATKPSGNAGIEQATQRVFDACAADAAQLEALIKAVSVR